MENTVAEEVSEEQVPVEEQIEIKPVTDTPKKSNGGIIFGCINLILIFLLVGMVYYLLQEVKDKQLAQSQEITKGDAREIEASKQLNVYQSQLAAMQSQIATFNEEITGKDNHFTQTLADFSQLHSDKLETARIDLTGEMTLIKRQLGKTRGDWLIADAEYLLSIANQRLHLVGDVETALLALEAADQRLRESGDSAAYKVREQITKEIAGLKTVSVPDIVGLYSRLQLLKENISELALLLPYSGKPLTESTQVHAHDEEQGSEHGLLSPVLNLLEGYVTVKHSDLPVTEIISEVEVKFIRQQLDVKLEMIKIALVQQEGGLYQASILDAQQWLKGNFTVNAAANKFQAELDDLNSVQIRSQFPDVSKSLKMLKNITKLRVETDKALFEPVEKESTNQAIVSPVTP